MADNYGLGIVQGFTRQLDRNRVIDRQEQQDNLNKRRIDLGLEHAKNREQREQDEHQRRMAALRRQAETEGTGRFIDVLDQTGNIGLAIEQYNRYGESKILPETVQFDQKTGRLSFKESDGDTFDGTLNDLKAVYGRVAKPAEPIKLGKGDRLVMPDDKGGYREVVGPVKDTGDTSTLPSEAQMIEYLVANGIAPNKNQAFALTRLSRTNPADAVMRYVEMAQEMQQAEGLVPGAEGYKTPEQLRADGIGFVREIQNQWMEQFRRQPGLDDADGNNTAGLSPELSRYSRALSVGPTKTRAAAMDEGGLDATRISRDTRTGQTTRAPYPEGTKLRGPDGGIYVVRNGVPVPMQGGR